jgi:transcription elongation factor GreA
LRGIVLDELREQLHQQIHDLDRELRVELPALIAKAVAMGDLRENAEYSAALERQELVRARLSQLTRRQSELSAINLRDLPRDRAAFGSRVELEDGDGERHEWHLVFPEFVDLDGGMISTASPLGRAIIGTRPGDEVTLEAPDGVRSFVVIEVITLHGERVLSASDADQKEKSDG